MVDMTLIRPLNKGQDYFGTNRFLISEGVSNFCSMMHRLATIHTLYR